MDFFVRHIIVIESLPDQDFHSGSELYNDVIVPNCNAFNNDMSHYFLKASSSDSFNDALNFVEQLSAHTDDGILLHIETHGCKDGIGLSDGSIFRWKELQEKLISINVTCDNQLYITMATCYGRYLYETAEIDKRASFSGFISSSKETTARKIIEDFAPFFVELIKNRKIIQAYKTLEAMESEFFYKDISTVFDQLIQDLYDRLDKDKEYRTEFIDECKQTNKDWGSKVSDGFVEKNIDAILKLTKKEMYKRYFENYLFGIRRPKL